MEYGGIARAIQFYKKGDKTHCIMYRQILSTANKIFIQRSSR